MKWKGLADYSASSSHFSYSSSVRYCLHLFPMQVPDIWQNWNRLLPASSARRFPHFVLPEQQFGLPSFSVHFFVFVLLPAVPFVPASLVWSLKVPIRWYFEELSDQQPGWRMRRSVLLFLQIVIIVSDIIDKVWLTSSRIRVAVWLIKYRSWDTYRTVPVYSLSACSRISLEVISRWLVGSSRIRISFWKHQFCKRDTSFSPPLNPGSACRHRLR